MSRPRRIGVRPGAVVIPAELAVSWARLVAVRAHDLRGLAEDDDGLVDDEWSEAVGQLVLVAAELGDAAMRAQLREGRVRKAVPWAKLPLPD